MSYLTDLNDLAERIHRNAVEHGFWEGPENDNFPTKIALIHSEASEALEEFRSGHEPGETYYSGIDEEIAEDPDDLDDAIEDGKAKPEGVPIELADIIIRVLDLAERYNINIQQAVWHKMQYNETRPYKHGKTV